MSKDREKAVVDDIVLATCQDKYSEKVTPKKIQEHLSWLPLNSLDPWGANDLGPCYKAKLLILGF